MTPPSTKPWQVKGASVPLMNETTSHASWTAIQILIAAPNREVCTPIVQFQTQVAGSMRQIEADRATLCVTRARNSCHVGKAWPVA